MSLRLAPAPKTPFAPLNQWLVDLTIELQRLDAENRKLRSDLEVALGTRLILHDTAGGRYVVDVEASGPTVQATAL